jgi:6-phosphogluconolactonase (cycloisomerase 2 family)
MKMGKRAWLLLAAAPLVAGLAGCGDFWQAPGSGTTSFTLTNGGNITVAPGATSLNTSTITVTPGSSFTGTVALVCAVTAPSGAANPTTCGLSSSSLTFSAATAQTSTLTATTQSGTTAGDYTLTVTGTSGSVSETTSVCVDVTNSTSGNCSSASGTSGIFYVLNQETNQVVAMSIASGKLTTIGSLTLPTAHPIAIAVAPNGNFLYVSTAGGIYLYTIESGGSLQLGNSGNVVSSDPAQTMQVDATNSWLVDAVSGSTQLAAIAINSSTGVLASAGETEQYFPGGLHASTPVQLAISPGDSSSCNDCYVFVALGDGGIEAIGFNPGNANPFGNAANHGVLHSGGDNAIAVDPSNRLLYVGEADALPSATQSGGLRVFTISSGGITELGGSPYTSGGTGPFAIVPTSDGNFVYIGNQAVSGSSTDNIASFSVSTTALTSINTAAAGPSGPLGLAVDSTGGYLMAVDFAGSPDLEIYSMSSGTLTSALAGTTGTDPVGAVAIAAAP